MTTTTTQNAIETVRAAFDFSVDKLPLFGPEGIRTGFYGLFRSDTGETARDRSCSRQYVPHTTDDVLALVEASADAFESEIEVRCHFDRGHHVAIAPSREYRRSVFGTADNVFPRVLIRAGYDGQAFQASVGYWRDACNNLAMLRQVRETSVSIRHTEQLRTRMDDLIETFRALRGGWDRLSEAISAMERREVRLADFLREVYGEPEAGAPARTRRSHERRTEAIFRRIVRERMKTGRPEIGPDFGVSIWEAFNAVQGYSQHEQRRQGDPGEFARILLASRDGAVRRAEEAALAYLAV